MTTKPTLDPHLELRAYNRELLAKVRQLTKKLFKVQADNVEFKQSLVEIEKELKVHRAKAKNEQITAINMVIVHPEIECPYCLKQFKPKSIEGGLKIG